MPIPSDTLPARLLTSSDSALCLLFLFGLSAACSSGSADSSEDIDNETSSSDDVAATDMAGGTESEAEDEATDEEETPLSPSLGEVIDIPAEKWSQGPIAVTPETGDEQYVVQLTSGSMTTSAKYHFDFEAVRPDSTPADPSGLISPKPRCAAADGLGFTLDHTANYRFWEDAAQALATGTPVASPAPRLEPPQVGDQTSFQISDNSAASFTTIEAEVLRVTDRLVVYADITNGIGALQSDVIDEVLSNYESVVLPRINTYFGEISDVNGDNKISVLFSPLVSEVGAAAYVYTCDILNPKEAGMGCPFSNEQEMIYVAPPSRLGSHMGSPKALTEVLSHETQHLVYFYRKYILGHGMMTFDAIYLNEGLSGLSQDLCGFQGGILFEAAAAIPNVEDFSLTDILALKTYDSTASYNYAIGYLLMRYAFEQMGGDSLTEAGQIVDQGGITYLHTIESSRFSGVDALEDAMGLDAADVFENFYTAMLLDDRGADGSNPSKDPRFGFFDMVDDPVTGYTRGVTMQLELAGGMFTSDGVPLGKKADGIIRSGGVEYILLEASGSRDPFTLDLVEETPEAKLRMRLVRIR